MKTPWLIATLIALPLAATAADAPKPAATTSLAAAPAASAVPVDSYSAVHQSKQRGSAMGVCRYEVGSRGLTGEAYKAAMVDCLKAQAQ